MVIYFIYLFILYFKAVENYKQEAQKNVLDYIFRINTD